MPARSAMRMWRGGAACCWWQYDCDGDCGSGWDCGGGSRRLGEALGEADGVKKTSPPEVVAAGPQGELVLGRLTLLVLRRLCDASRGEASVRNRVTR